jgi:hypothetical protein
MTQATQASRILGLSTTLVNVPMTRNFIAIEGYLEEVGMVEGVGGGKARMDEKLWQTRY